MERFLSEKTLQKSLEGSLYHSFIWQPSGSDWISRTISQCNIWPIVSGWICFSKSSGICLFSVSHWAISMQMKMCRQRFSACIYYAAFLWLTVQYWLYGSLGTNIFNQLIPELVSSLWLQTLDIRVSAHRPLCGGDSALCKFYFILKTGRAVGF